MCCECGVIWCDESALSHNLIDASTLIISHRQPEEGKLLVVLVRSTAVEPGVVNLEVLIDSGFHGVVCVCDSSIR